MIKKIVFVIPAHLASIRLSKKILLNIFGLPMIEHVRRRILLTNTNFKVYVATCDKKIEDIINSYGGNVINTSRNHTNGTSRVCEAINKIDCTHVILVQGDEPLILPKQINKFYTRILNDNNNYIWNATSKINKIFFNKHSFVKCLVNNKGNISELFRKYSDLNNSVKSYQKNNINGFFNIVLLLFSNKSTDTGYRQDPSSINPRGRLYGNKVYAPLL